MKQNTGIRNLIGGFTGQDPITGQKYQSSDRMFVFADGAMQLAGTIGTATSIYSRLTSPCQSWTFGSCFVGDTLVVVAIETPLGTTIGIASAESSLSEVTGSVESPLYFVGAGVAGFIMLERPGKSRGRITRRTKRVEPPRPGNKVRSSAITKQSLPDQPSEDSSRGQTSLITSTAKQPASLIHRPDSSGEIMSSQEIMSPNDTLFTTLEIAKTPWVTSESSEPPMTRDPSEIFHLSLSAGMSSREGEAPAERHEPTRTRTPPQFGKCPTPPATELNAASELADTWSPNTLETETCDQDTEFPPRKPSLSILWLVSCLFLAFGSLLPTGVWKNLPTQQAIASAPASILPQEQTPKLKYRQIKDIRTGMRVVAENPELEGLDLPDTPIDPPTWRNIHLQMQKPDGSDLHITLLRSVDWLQQRATRWTLEELENTTQSPSLAKPEITLDLPEIGAAGPATVLAVEACPNIDQGPGRVVTGTFHHSSAEVLDLYLTGEDKPIGTTANHPFWSETRKEFVQAGSLSVGETLRNSTSHCESVKGRVSRPDRIAVFNIEVVIQHCYAVANVGVLVHNTYATNQPQANRGIVWKPENTGNRNQSSVDYESALIGARSNLQSHRREVPALLYDNPNPNGRSYVRFDGIDSDNPKILIDRKWAVTTKSQQVDKFKKNVLNALDQNKDYKLRIEVPNERAASDAKRLIRDATASNKPHPQIEIVVVPQ